MDGDPETPQWDQPRTPRPLSIGGSPSTFTFMSYTDGAILLPSRLPLPKLQTPPLPPENVLEENPRQHHQHGPSRTTHDENLPPSTPGPSKRAKIGSAQSSGAPRQKMRSEAEKMHTILDTIQAQGWSLGEFMYNIFRSTGREAKPSQTHAQMVSAFLAGRGKFKPSGILTCWMKSSDGVLPADSPHLAQMYSADIPYTEIGPVRPALTSFALQTVGKFLARRAETVQLVVVRLECRQRGQEDSTDQGEASGRVEGKGINTK
ncbi:hypothetical protein C8R47DRAFT_1324704 [Mycena vitilis]|nr:hypothetical protein C8R47DRAFT_1324704 [Mycena vitilis]